MTFVKEPEALTVARKRFNDAEAAYCKMFGENSLDRMAYIDPLHPMIEEYESAANMLVSAIRHNKPIEQAPKEIWESLVF